MMEKKLGIYSAVFISLLIKETAEREHKARCVKIDDGKHCFSTIERK